MRNWYAKNKDAIGEKRRTPEYRAREREYCAGRREELRAYKRAYYAKNKERILARQREKRALDPEKTRQRSRQDNLKFRLSNPEKHRARANEYRLKNLEKVREAKQVYYQINKGKINTRLYHNRLSAINKLADSYVLHLLGLTRKEAPQVLIDLKREQTRLFRLLRDRQRAANQALKEFGI